MARFIKQNKSTVGQSPGTLIFTGIQKMQDTRITVTDFDGEDLIEDEIQTVSDLKSYKEKSSITWINVTGLHDIEIIREIGELLEIDNLALEDILNIGQRPKFEEFDNLSLINLKMLRLNESTDTVIQEQISIIFGENYLLTFQEETGDVFDSVRERLRKKRGRIRNRKSDYLAYALVDTIVDNYIFIIEYFGEKIEAVESRLLSNHKPDLINIIYSYKRELNYLRKVVRPVRECVIGFAKSENGFLHKNTGPFLKDLLDHVTSGAEVIEIYRDMLSDQLNIYHTDATNRLNEIIRILTIFSVFFIPLTFIAGIYGTNFKYFPELDFKYAYPLFWLLLIFIATGMYFYFKRKKWI